MALQRRLDHVYPRAEPGEVRQVDAVRAPDGDANCVHRDRVVLPEIEKQLGRVRVRQEVLGMDFEPIHVRSGGHDLCQVRQPQADPSAGPGQTV